MLFALPRNHRHARRAKRAADRSPAQSLRSAAMQAIESLEPRRLLSTTYAVANTISEEPGVAFNGFGQIMTARDNLVLVGQTTADSGLLSDVGQATLYDATTGAVIRTFENPDPQDFDGFGSAVALLDGGKIAITSAENTSGVANVYVYDSASDTTPGVISDPFGTFTGFGSTIAAYGDDLLVHEPNFGGAGAIILYDTDTLQVVDTFHSTNTGGVADDQFGSAMVGDANSGTILASANFGVSGAAVEIDVDTASVARTFSDPAPVGAGYGDAVAYTDSSILISNFDDSTVSQFNRTDGNFVRSYSDPLNNSGFGLRVATSGELAAFTSGSNTVYVFDTTDGSLEGQLDAPAGSFSFGDSLAALDGGRFAVGDSLATANDDTALAGAVYVFAPQSASQPPVADAGPDQSAVRQFAVDFDGSGSTGDNLVSYEWDFDYDGITFDVDASGVTTSHVFTDSGTYTVGLRVTDDASQSAINTALVTVTSGGVVDGDLLIGGTGGTDIVLVTGNSSGGVDVTIDGSTTSYSPTGRIVIQGGDSADAILLGSSITQDTEIHGGAGNDVIQGGSGSDVMIGGAGDDVLSGGAGRDLVVGGKGNDLVASGQGDDILIGGTTSFDNDSDALIAIQAEWKSSRDYDTRVANLQDGSGSVDRLNGGYFLVADVTVFDDGDSDFEMGGAGTDWYFANTDSGIRDLATKAGNETLNDVDVIPA